MTRLHDTYASRGNTRRSPTPRARSILISQQYKNRLKAANVPAARVLRLISVILRKRHKPGASREKRRCAASICTLYAAFILVQLFKKTPVNRHSALDAESSGFKFRCVTLFNDTRCRGKPGMTMKLYVLKKFSHYNIEGAAVPLRRSAARRFYRRKIRKTPRVSPERAQRCGASVRSRLRPVARPAG